MLEQWNCPLYQSMETVLPTDQSLLLPAPIAPVRKPLFSSLRKKFSKLFSFSPSSPTSETADSTPPYYADAGQAVRPSTSNTRKRFKKNKFLFIFVVAIVLLVFTALFASMKKNSSGTTVLGQQKLRLNDVKSQETLNKKFQFPIRDGSGKEVTKITYLIQNAELRDQIVVKGRPADAIEGRIFLILNLKLTNDYTKTISLNTRDFVRMTINGSNEKMAFDIHNDPVEVLAGSVKVTRLAMAINTTDKDITLLVGEVNGPKQTIKVHFTK